MFYFRLVQLPDSWIIIFLFPVLHNTTETGIGVYATHSAKMWRKPL
jgi:hypothetical protein